MKSWVIKGLENAKMQREALRDYKMQGEIKEKLIELVKKYADKACS